MTGHQAAFWHPGILAKFLAVDAAGRALGAAPAWLFVDQDDPPADTVVRCPVRREGGRFDRATWDVARSGPPPKTGIPMADAGLERIAQAWQSSAAEAAPARRVALALAELMRPLVLPGAAMFATGLHDTDLFASIVEAMRRDPEGCIRAYNDAARAHPTAGIRPLEADAVQDRWELPLWRLNPGEPDAPRRRVFAEGLGEIPMRELAPRALLLTGLVRLAGCDLFVHGTGGGGDETHEGYDRVTEDWLRAWGRSDANVGELAGAGLAPAAIVTATLRLPVHAEAIPGPRDVARAEWVAHRARHDPALLGDEAAANARADLVERIAELPRHSHERAELFDQLHRLLARVRAERGARLEALAGEAARARALAASREVLDDRTWPFPLYPQADLRSLRDGVDASFGARR